jgi:hypothetical protein
MAIRRKRPCIRGESLLSASLKMRVKLSRRAVSRHAITSGSAIQSASFAVPRQLSGEPVDRLVRHRHGGAETIPFSVVGPVGFQKGGQGGAVERPALVEELQDDAAVLKDWLRRANRDASRGAVNVDIVHVGRQHAVVHDDL